MRWGGLIAIAVASVRISIGSAAAVGMKASEAGRAWDPPRVIDVDGGRAERIIVHAGPNAAAAGAAPTAVPVSRMLGELDGIAGVVQGETAVRAVTSCLAPPVSERGEVAAFAAEVPGTVRLWVLECQRAERVTRVEVLQTAAAGLVAHAIDPAGKPTPLVKLQADKFREVAAAWSAYQGGFTAPAETDRAGEGKTVELPKPYIAGRCTLDKPTVSHRFAAGLATSLPVSERDLAKETLFARLPRGYDPRTPAGLLVWVDPSPVGRVPDVFAPALDQLGLIAIGAANSGNDRMVTDRYQLALDAAATASSRWHIDPRRVYITGISGGGKVSSVMAACFPEVFTGSVPIVGLGLYSRVPMGEIGQFAAPLYKRPDPARFALFRGHRLAAMTGPPDFNYTPVSEGVKILARDGVAAKLYEYPDMGHQAPTPERFLEALTWVDEPYQTQWKKETDQGQRLLEACLAQGQTGAQPPPSDASRRKALMHITEVAPWTPAAWRAVELLKGGTGL